MLCSKCKKNSAILFISPEDSKNGTAGLCMSCARSEGLNPMSNLIAKIGIKQEDFDILHIMTLQQKLLRSHK